MLELAMAIFIGVWIIPELLAIGDVIIKAICSWFKEIPFEEWPEEQQQAYTAQRKRQEEYDKNDKYYWHKMTFAFLWFVFMCTPLFASLSRVFVSFFI